MIFRCGAGRGLPLNSTGLGCKFLCTETASCRATCVSACLQSRANESEIKPFSQLLEKNPTNQQPNHQTKRVLLAGFPPVWYYWKIMGIAVAGNERGRRPGRYSSCCTPQAPTLSPRIHLILGCSRGHKFPAAPESVLASG